MQKKWFEKTSWKQKKQQFFQSEIKKAFQKASWVFQAGQDKWQTVYIVWICNGIFYEPK